MNHHHGFATVTVLLVVLGILVLGAGGYVAMNPEAFTAPSNEEVGEDTSTTHEEEHESNGSAHVNTKTSISWRFADLGEIEGTPYTMVTVVLNGTAYEMGKFAGSCSEIDATGGVDGKGLLAGELSAAQCWFAGGGNEIGVFAHENGGFDLMIGELSEGAEGAGMFRGDFTVKTTLPL